MVRAMGVDADYHVYASVIVYAYYSQGDRMRERAQMVSAAGAAPGRAHTPGSDPTEWECHKGHIKKEPLPPDSQSARQPLRTNALD
ncbi:unnamed protein product [Schistocephalus solidus]|uniref:Uncharacterized protein n=1 Tax=Schistocephalus solidus TaxID=70667 RepID=A0A3P7EDT4_SCHSO|nr:unnamed protein product [Schistocephalus solidus]